VGGDWFPDDTSRYIWVPRALAPLPPRPAYRVWIGVLELWLAVVCLALVRRTRESGLAGRRLVALCIGALVLLALPTPFVLFDTQLDPRVPDLSQSWPRDESRVVSGQRARQDHLPRQPGDRRQIVGAKPAMAGVLALVVSRVANGPHGQLPQDQAEQETEAEQGGAGTDLRP
jgi:hypothetical protein